MPHTSHNMPGANLCQAKLLGRNPTKTDPVLSWVGPLANQVQAVLSVNNRETPQTLQVHMSAVVGSAGTSLFTVRDIWKHKDLPGTYTSNDTLSFPSVGGHDCVMLTVRHST